MQHAESEMMLVNTDSSSDASGNAFLEMRRAYTNLLLKLVEANNAREFENKEKILALQMEISELNAEKKAYSNLESVYMDACATVENLYQNEERLLEECKKLSRELLQVKAKYSSLLSYSSHKIQELSQETKRLTEAHRLELSTLKAKNFRLESTSKTVQQILEANEKEIAELRAKRDDRCA